MHAICYCGHKVYRNCCEVKSQYLIDWFRHVLWFEYCSIPSRNTWRIFDALCVLLSFQIDSIFGLPRFLPTSNNNSEYLSKNNSRHVLVHFLWYNMHAWMGLRSSHFIESNSSRIQLIFDVTIYNDDKQSTCNRDSSLPEKRKVYRFNHVLDE